MATRAPDQPRSSSDGLVRAFHFLGKRWNGMLLAALGAGPAGFAELTRALPGISESVLADRLNELARGGLITRIVREGPPIGVSYQLTPGGEALLPVLSQLADWASEHLTDENCAKALGRAVPDSIQTQPG